MKLKNKFILFPIFNFVIIFILCNVVNVFADVNSEIDKLLSLYPHNYYISVLKDGGNDYYYKEYIACDDIDSNSICGCLVKRDNGICDFAIVSLSGFDYYSMGFKMEAIYNDVYKIYLGGVSSAANYFEYDLFTNIVTFSTYEDCVSYLKYGVINGAIYIPIGYDSNIPTPKNLEVYFNRKLESPFNIGDMHSPINIKWEVPEGEDYSDYTLETYIDVNYNKINSLGGIGTKPTVLNTGRVKLYEENASHCQMNISDTCEGWSALSEKFDTSVWGITGNYLDLWIRYVDSGGNYGNWVKVHITPSNSGSVIKFGGTNTTINKGYEEISGEDNTTKVDDSQYGDKYFVSTKDNGFSESVTNLKSQFGDLISFFSSLFSFLPKEVWELLVAFIGAGCLVALFKFIRG